MMWHKLRKVLTGVPVIPPSSVSPGAEESLRQRGYLEPRPAGALLDTESRQHLLRQLWENSLLPKTHYEQYCLAPLKRCVSLMQQLPATADGHHAVPGGMVDYTLKTVVYALRLSRGYMLPPGASVEEQSAQSAAWSVVVFYAALFHSLSSLRQIEGELLNGEIWYPGISVPGQPYRFRFRPDIPDGAGEGLCTMLGMRLLPGEVIIWLSQTPPALDELLSFIRGDFGHASAISEIVGDAIQHAGGDPGSVLYELSVSVPQSPPVAAQPPASTATDTVTGSGVALTPSVETSGEGALPAEGHLQVPLDVSIPLTSAVDENISPPIHAVQAEQSEGDPAIQDVLSLMGFDTRSSVDEGGPKPATPVSQNMNELPPAGADGAVSSGGSPPVATTLLPHKTRHSDPVENDDYGQRFISWLSTKILSGALCVNTREAQVHIVGGLVFLPTPNIFFSFMKDNDYDPSLKGDVQRGFERLGLHFIQKGKGVFSCLKYEDENRKGRYEKMSGYLIRSKIIYASHPVPEDSLFLFVSRGIRL